MVQWVYASILIWLVFEEKQRRKTQHIQRSGNIDELKKGQLLRWRFSECCGLNSLLGVGTGHLYYVHLAGTCSNPILPADHHSSWHKFNKLLEMFLRDLGPYWRGSVTQLLQVYQLSFSHVITSQRSSLDSGPGVQRTLCHVREANLRLVACYLAGSSHTVSERIMFKQCSTRSKKAKYAENISLTHSSASSSPNNCLYIKMDGASAFKKEANTEVSKNCILLFGQQGPP